MVSVLVIWNALPKGAATGWDDIGNEESIVSGKLTMPSGKQMRFNVSKRQVMVWQFLT